MLDWRCKSINNCYIRINVLHYKTNQDYVGCFQMEYKEIEDNLTNWKRKKNVEGDGQKRHNAFPSAQVLF